MDRVSKKGIQLAILENEKSNWNAHCSSHSKIVNEDSLLSSAFIITSDSFQFLVEHSALYDSIVNQRHGHN
jgi:hypothetical protein